MSDIDFAQLGRERTASAKQAFDIPPDLPVASPEGCPAPQQEPAGLGASSSQAPGPVDYDAMLADVEAKAQRALQMTTGKRTSARLQISPWASLFIYWERQKPPKKRWQFWI